MITVYRNGVVVPQNNQNDDWEVTVDCVTACSKAPDVPVVLIEPIVKWKIDALMKKYTSREWLGYFFVKVDKPFHIIDMVIPEQVATSARVDDIEFSSDQIPEGMKVGGVIHSHHNMGATFSGTDDEFINGNHDISVLVAHSGMKCRVRINVPCGAKIIKEAKMKLNYIVNFDEEGFLREAEANIKDRTYNYTNKNWMDDNYPFTGGNRSQVQSDTQKTEELFAGLEKEMTLEEELKAAFTVTQQNSDDSPVTDESNTSVDAEYDEGPGAGPDN